MSWWCCMNKRLTKLFWECVQAPFIPPPEIPDECYLLNKFDKDRLKNYNRRIIEVLSDESSIDVLADIAKSDFHTHTITHSINILIEQRRKAGLYNEMYEKVI